MEDPVSAPLILLASGILSLDYLIQVPKGRIASQVLHSNWKQFRWAIPVSLGPESFWILHPWEISWNGALMWRQSIHYIPRGMWTTLWGRYHSQMGQLSCKVPAGPIDWYRKLFEGNVLKVTAESPGVFGCKITLISGSIHENGLGRVGAYLQYTTKYSEGHITSPFEGKTCVTL